MLRRCITPERAEELMRKGLCVVGSFTNGILWTRERVWRKRGGVVQVWQWDPGTASYIALFRTRIPLKEWKKQEEITQEFLRNENWNE